MPFPHGVASRPANARLRPAMSDLRHAIRGLLRAPSFTAVAIVSLALGIGANVTIYSFADAFLNQPIRGAADPDRLVRIYRGDHSPLSPADLAFVRANTRAFSDVGGEHMLNLALGTADGAERIMGTLVSDGYFAALRVRPALGRTFTASDSASRARVVVISDALWQRRFAGDLGVLGTAIRINEQPYQIIGVAPREFGSSLFLFRADVWLPPSAAPLLVGAPMNEWGGSVYVTARLAPGVSRAAASAAVRTIAARLAADRPEEHREFTLRVDDARGIVAEQRGPTIAATAFLVIVVAFVLLIACANVTNLLLARGMARSREIGIRIALGATRARLVRQLLVESLVLAIAAGLLGALAASWVSDLLARFVMARSPEPIAVGIDADARLIVFTAALSALTALVFGLAPALRATKGDLARSIREESPRTTSRTRARAVLVGAQVALCSVLLACSTLFVRSLLKARVIDPGFDPSGVVDVAVDPSVRNPTAADRARFFRDLVESARALPGVRSATLAAIVPLGGTNMQAGTWVAGRTSADDRANGYPYFNQVGGDYFATMGIPIVAGRAITDADLAADAEVVVVNQRFAAHTWPGESALGKRISIEGARGPWLTVIGVTKDTKYTSLGEQTPDFMYLTLPREGRRGVVLQARGVATGPGLQRTLLDLVRRLDPRLPPPIATTLAEDMRVALLPAQLGATLVGTFGLLALLLASIGVYGIAAYTVAQRTRELGIRSALGASARSLLTLVVRGSLRVVVAGAAVGLVAALGVARLIASQLYGVGSADPVTFIGMPMFLIAAGVLATLVPALRATRVDPAAALRAE